MSLHFTGVILDIDGTLIDSNRAHAQAWMKAMRASGVDVNYEEVRSLIGMGGDQLIPKLAGVNEQSDLGAKISRLRKQIFANEYFPHLRKFPKSRRLLLRMKRMGLKIAVATSAEQSEVRNLLQIARVDDLVEPPKFVSGDEPTKPSPDLIYEALRELKMPSYKAVMIGDTPYDIEAAAKAGVASIALRCGGWNDRSLRGALAIYDDPEDLWLRFNSSPLATPLLSTTG